MNDTFALEAREQAQLDQDYADWCRKFDPNYIVERETREDKESEV